MDRGDLLWEYHPPAAHPMLWAGIVAFGAVFLMGSVENLLRENRAELYAVYAAPLVVTALLMVLLRPGPVRLHVNGIVPGHIAIVRPFRSFIPWSQVAAAYPCHYDVTGAYVSPFASSDGKVTQTGLAIETLKGRTTTLRFTPTRFARNTRRSRGFREAYDIVQQRMAAHGRPMVPSAPTFTADERARMEAEARAPFMPFFVIVAMLASAAPVLGVLVAYGNVDIALALPIALVMPAYVVLRSGQKSRQRNRILNALSKSIEHERSVSGSANVAVSSDDSVGLNAQGDPLESPRLA